MTNASATCAECGDWVDVSTSVVAMRTAFDQRVLCDRCEGEGGR